MGQVRDFFISYTWVNKPWAEWIAVELERAGYTTVLQAFDFRAGANFVHEMQSAIASAARTIAVLSPAYLGSRFAGLEWQVALARDPMGERGLLLLVRVQSCEPPELLATRDLVDLFDVDESVARERLLAAVGPPRARPTVAPFPGGRSDGDRRDAGPSVSARFPGAGTPATNMGPWNRNFTGRDEALSRLHAAAYVDRPAHSSAGEAIAAAPVAPHRMSARQDLPGQDLRAAPEASADYQLTRRVLPHDNTSQRLEPTHFSGAARFVPVLGVLLTVVALVWALTALSNWDVQPTSRTAAIVAVLCGVVAVGGLLVALGNAGYLAMLNSAARKRGLSGESAALFVKERRGVAVGTTAVAALGLLLTLGGSVPVDVLGAVLAAGGGVAAKRALDGTRDRFRGGA